MSKLERFIDKKECPRTAEIISYNSYLAEEYYAAMIAEDFELLTHVDVSYIINIVGWLTVNCYDKKIIDKIYDGSFITCSGKTFIDVIKEKKILNFIEAYLELGSEDNELLLLYMLNTKKRPNYEIINNTKLTNEKLNNHYEKLLIYLEQQFEELKTPKEKITFLKRIKPYLEKMRTSIFQNDGDVINKYKDYPIIKKLEIKKHI